MKRQSGKPRSEEAIHRIFEASAGVFAEEGFAGARMDEIARRSGMNKAMLYYHVGDKSALYNMVLLTVIQKIRSILSAAVEEEETPEGKLRAFIAAMAKVSIETHYFPPLVMREIATEGANLSPPVLEAMSGIFAIILSILREGEAKGRFRPVNPLLTHMQIMGTIVFLTRARPVGEQIGRLKGIIVSEEHMLSVEEVTRHVTQVMLYGLKPGKAAADGAAQANGG